MKARASITLALIALAAVLAPSPGRSQDAAPARTEEQLRQALDGTWHLTISHAAGQAAIDRAIDRAVADMNFFLQGVTRTQIREKTPVNRRIDLDFASDGRVTCIFDQAFTYTTRPGVGQDFDLPDGSSVNVTQLFRDGHLEQIFATTLGRRWNTYTLSADGQTMTVAATTQGPMMPHPVYFTLDYRQRQ